MVTEIQSKALHSAANMQLLVDAMEQRLSALFSGRSPLVKYGVAGVSPGSGEMRGFGRFFYFKGGGTITRLASVSAYDQEAFGDAVADADLVGIDEVNQIINLSIPTTTDFNGGNQNLLHGSLKIHFREESGIPYQVTQNNLSWPDHERLERVRWYEVAEIVIEGHTEFEWDPDWNKYRFLRFHNLSASPLTLDFEGSSHNIQPFGVMTTRWEMNGNVSTGQYLWPYLIGDTRLHYVMDQRMTANNVCNPEILLWWISKNFNPVPRQFGFRLDASEIPSISGYGSLFGDSTHPETKLGDLFHHKGQIMVIRKDSSEDPWTSTVMEFRGYGSIVEDFAAVGVVASLTGGAYTLTPQTVGGQIDLVPISTNLLDKAGVPVFAATLPYTIEHQLSVSTHPIGSNSLQYLPTVATQFAGTPFTLAPSDSPVEEDGETFVESIDIGGTHTWEAKQSISYIPTVQTASLAFEAQDTIQDVIDTLAGYGWTVKGSKLTAHGHLFEIEHQTANNAVRASSPVFSAAESHANIQPGLFPLFDPTTATRTNTHIFIGNVGWNPFTWLKKHQSIYPKNPIQYGDGAETEFTADKDRTTIFGGLTSRTKSTFARLAKLSETADSSQPWRAVYLQNSYGEDALANFSDEWWTVNRSNILAKSGSTVHRVRPTLAIEDYNTIAGWINAIIGITPIQAYEVYPSLAPITIGIETTVTLPTPRTPFTGLFPVGFYSFVNDSNRAFYVVNGIPIKTIADFPASYATAKALRVTWADQPYEISWTKLADLGGSPALYDVEYSYSADTPSTSSDQIPTIPINPFNATSFEWVHQDDVLAWCESQGLSLWQFFTGYPVRIKTVDVPAPAVHLDRSPLEINGVEDHAGAGGVEYTAIVRHIPKAVILEPVTSADDAEFFVSVSGKSAQVRNITDGSNIVDDEALILTNSWASTRPPPSALLLWLRVDNDLDYIRWAFDCVRPYAIMFGKTEDLDMVFKARLHPVPFDRIDEQWAFTNDAIRFQNLDDLREGIHGPITHFPIGNNLDTTYDLSDSDQPLAIIHTSEQGVYQPIVHLDFQAV